MAPRATRLNVVHHNHVCFVTGKGSICGPMFIWTFCIQTHSLVPATVQLLWRLLERWFGVEKVNTISFTLATIFKLAYRIIRWCHFSYCNVNFYKMETIYFDKIFHVSSLFVMKDRKKAGKFCPFLAF